eukprot:5991994-Pyramimonas_sp.AAC.1
MSMNGLTQQSALLKVVLVGVFGAQVCAELLLRESAQLGEERSAEVRAAVAELMAQALLCPHSIVDDGQ